MLIMQTANDAMNLNQYLICCLLVLIPSYVLAAGSLRLWDSPTILAQYWGFYLVLHAVFMLLALVSCRNLLARWHWWRVVLLGVVMGILATCLSIPLSTVIALEDGAVRLANSYPLVGWIQAIAIYCVLSFYTYAWLLGAVVFVSVKGLARHKHATQ